MAQTERTSSKPGLYHGAAPRNTKSNTKSNTQRATKKMGRGKKNPAEAGFVVNRFFKGKWGSSRFRHFRENIAVNREQRLVAVKDIVFPGVRIGEQSP